MQYILFFPLYHVANLNRNKGNNGFVGCVYNLSYFTVSSQVEIDIYIIVISYINI